MDNVMNGKMERMYGCSVVLSRNLLNFVIRNKSTSNDMKETEITPDSDMSEGNMLNVLSQ